MKNNETLNLLSRYINNKMSDEERNDFERQLERDPFLADAYDGMVGVKFSVIEHDIQSINLHSGGNHVGLYKIVLLGIAALIALVFVFYVFIRQPEVEIETIAHNDFERSSFLLKSDTVLLKGQSDTLVDSDVDTIRILVADTQTGQLDKKREAKLLRNESELNREIASVPVAEIKEKVKDEVVHHTLEVNENSQSQKFSHLKPEVKSISSAIRIIPEDDTITDVESVSDLEESNVVDEVVENQDLAQKRMGIHANAQPLGGMSRFRAYVDESLTYPADIEKIQREVVKLQFDVSLAGNPQNFNILKAPSNNAFAVEAMRIIKDGPRWSPAIHDGLPVEEVHVLRIVFKPEK